MKNSIKLNAIALVSFAATSIFSMNINYGILYSYNYEISGYKYINNGTISAMNDIDMDVSSLSGSGSIFAKNSLSIKSGLLDYSGKISSSNDCTITVKSFKGNAHIEAKTIFIICDEFDFSGDIKCHDLCTIYSKKDINPDSFTRSGNGKFKIVSSPNEVRLFTNKELESESHSYLYNQCLSYSDKAVINYISDIRTQAVLNFMDDKAVLKNIKSSLEGNVNFHKQRLGESRDMRDIYTGLAELGVSAVSLVGAGYCFKKLRDMRKDYSADSEAKKPFIFGIGGLSGLISIIGAGVSIPTLYEGFYPRHQEKYDRLCVVVDYLDKAISEDRVPQEKIFIFDSLAR